MHRHLQRNRAVLVHEVHPLSVILNRRLSRIKQRIILEDTGATRPGVFSFAWFTHLNFCFVSVSPPLLRDCLCLAQLINFTLRRAAVCRKATLASALVGVALVVGIVVFERAVGDPAQVGVRGGVVQQSLQHGNGANVRRLRAQPVGGFAAHLGAGIVERAGDKAGHDVHAHKRRGFTPLAGQRMHGHPSHVGDRVVPGSVTQSVHAMVVAVMVHPIRAAAPHTRVRMSTQPLDHRPRAVLARPRQRANRRRHVPPILAAEPLHERPQFFGIRRFGFVHQEQYRPTERVP